jgi:hypothetical protein
MDKCPVTITPVNGYYQAYLGACPLWDPGTLDFALAVAESYLTGKSFNDITGQYIIAVNPKAFTMRRV